MHKITFLKMPEKAVGKKQRRLLSIPKPSGKRIHCVLSGTFYVLWIIIGLFAILLIIQSIRQGVLTGLFGSSQQEQAVQEQAQTETNIPGVGKVNIACVEQSLSPDTIQKIITDKGTSTLTNEEMNQLEPCIVEKAEASPSAF